MAIEKKRIEWIDIAKAIAILLMIAGHTFSYGSYVRNIIFSFHMPLFLILSGYTFHFCDNWNDIKKKEWNDFKQLICPVFVILLIGIIYNVFHGYGFMELVKNDVLAFLWGSGIKVYSYPALGAMWFLISMFWARLVLRILGKVFPHEYALTGGLGCGVIALLLGSRMAMPQNFDVTLMAVMFMTIGIIIKEHSGLIRKYKIPLFVLSMIIWLGCLDKSIYIELATRSYPYGMLSVIEAVCGSYICCIFARMCTFMKHRKLLNLLGRNTLEFLEIHCVDYIWAPLFQISKSTVVICIMRIVMDFLVFLIVMGIKKGIHVLKGHV